MAILLVVLICPRAVHASGPPRVVASIPPLHSLVAGITAGIVEPYPLLRAGTSPHTYSLRPSDARALHAATVVFLIDPSLETFLGKPLASLGADTRVVILSRAAGIERLAVRRGDDWQGHDHQTAEHAHHAGFDPHLWLEPRNARAMVRTIAGVMVEIDPLRAASYRANALELEARLDDLDRELATVLAPVRAVPYAVFHDAYQYLERSYGLNAVAAVTLDPERRPGARRLREIRQRLSETGARCLFSEPQFPPAVADTVTEGSSVRRGVLDPLGADLTAGPELYFRLMRNLAESLRDCLGEG